MNVMLMSGYITVDAYLVNVPSINWLRDRYRVYRYAKRQVAKWIDENLATELMNQKLRLACWLVVDQKKLVDREIRILEFSEWLTEYSPVSVISFKQFNTTIEGIDENFDEY